MLFQRVNRTDPEKIFLVVYNSYSTAAITNGQAVQWDFTTDQDGVGVTIPTARITNQGFATAGIVATASIAAGDYGLLQVYGKHSATRVRGVTGGGVVAVPGMPMAMNAAGAVFCLETFATHFTGVHIWPSAFMLSTLTNQFTTVAKGVFVKTL
jgi:hypothetical protein